LRIGESSEKVVIDKEANKLKIKVLKETSLYIEKLTNEETQKIQQRVARIYSRIPI
jgi:hypothetical protein